MNIHYARFHGVSVSKKWWVVLRHLENAGIKFELNSGHRTMIEQGQMFRRNMRWDSIRRRWVQRPGRPLTAVPSPNAPHVRVGRAAHALDIKWNDGGVTRVAKHLRSHGAHVSFPVHGEPWHLEISEDDLTKLWRKLS